MGWWDHFPFPFVTANCQTVDPSAPAEVIFLDDSLLTTYTLVRRVKKSSQMFVKNIKECLEAPLAEIRWNLLSIFFMLPKYSNFSIFVFFNSVRLFIAQLLPIFTEHC